MATLPSETPLSGSTGLQALEPAVRPRPQVRPLPNSFPLDAKRGIDVVLSLAAIILLSPVLLIIACAIKFGSKGPVLYCSERVGKNGRRFVFYKFRTMVPDADLIKAQLRRGGKNERVGPLFKLCDDPRITPIGKWLRRYSLDELPQLWNVLIGDMSLVGPRPHAIEDFGLYSPQHLQRLTVTPGITGLWQVTARREPSFDKNIALDLEYIERWSIWLDLEILLRTVAEVLKGQGC
jgi:lipopolysaccharide/colanic/teichoic acid biosynthesis glycosyltransferase